MGALRNGGLQGYTNNSSQSESRSYFHYTTAHKEKSSFLQQRNLGTQTHSRWSTENELKGVLFCLRVFLFSFLFLSQCLVWVFFFPYKSFAYVLEFLKIFMGLLCGRISVLQYLSVFLVSFLWFLFVLFAYFGFFFGTILFFILFIC